MKRGALALALAMLATACSLGQPAPDATGQEIYEALCSRCHGTDLGGGGLGPPLGPDSGSAREADEYLEFTIMNGRGSMPSFSSLEAAQVDRLVAYIREVQTGE